MGTWDAGIFDDDLASDLRADFEELIADGTNPKRAADHLLKEYCKQKLTEDEDVVLHLALAKLLHDNGVAQHHVIEKAIDYVASDAGLERWAEQGPSELAARHRVYRDLEKELQKPATSSNRVVLPTVGDVLLIPLPNSKYAYAQYVFADPERGPYLQVFDLITDEPLSIGRLDRLEPLLPPLLVGLNPPVRDGRWKILGKLALKPFKHPRALSLILDRDKKPHWFLVERNSRKALGSTVPEQYKHLETSAVINASGLVECIMHKLTGDPRSLTVVKGERWS